MNKKTKTPLFHVAKRAALPWYKAWAIRGAALLLALVLCGVITSLVTGENPFAVYAAIWKGSFGTTRNSGCCCRILRCCCASPSR